jgi:glutathione S-transferase
MADYEFSYWGIRGLAQPLRFLWAHLDLKVEDKFADREEWFGKHKPEQAKTFDFPNLPYIKKGDYILTESVAIA